MKKILITVAAAASFAAIADTTVNGAVNEYVVSSKSSDVSLRNVVSDQSYLKFKSVEQLSSGLAARVVIDTTILANDPTTHGQSTQFGDRQSTVGLSTKYGSIDIGRGTHGTYRTLTSVDAFAGSFGSLSLDVHNQRNQRLGNAVFITGAPLTNVSVSYDRSLDNTLNAYNIAATIDFKYGSASVSRFSDAVGNTTNVVGGVAQVSEFDTKLFGSYSRDVTGTQLSYGTLIGVTQPIPTTAFTVKASYGYTSSNASVHGANIGVSYALSTRTSIDAVYKHVSGSTDLAALAVGLRHAF